MGGQFGQARVEVHPPPVRKTIALVIAAALQGLPGRWVAGVAEEKRGDIGVHVVGAGLHPGHAPFIGQLLAGFVDLMGQVGDREYVNIFMTVGLP